jgi:type I restriction enzyme S subunit
MTPPTTRGERRLDALPRERQAGVFGSVDLFIGASQSVIDQMDVVRKGLVQRLLWKGMGHQAFKRSPIGDIPAGWDVKPLGEIARLASGKTKPKDASHVRSPSHSVSIYGGKGLVGFSGSSLRKGVTVVVGRIGAHCGEVHFVSEEESWITDNALFVYETKPEVDIRFLYHSLSQRDLSSLRNLGRQPLISLSIMYPILLALPPLTEQRRICEVLLSLETLMDVQDRVLGQAQRVRSALRADLP